MPAGLGGSGHLPSSSTLAQRTGLKPKKLGSGFQADSGRQALINWSLGLTDRLAGTSRRLA